VKRYREAGETRSSDRDIDDTDCLSERNSTTEALPVTSARFHVTLSEGTWLADASRTHPRSVFRVRGLALDGDDGIGRTLLSVITGDSGLPIDDVTTHDDVTTVDVFRRNDDWSTMCVNGIAPEFIRLARRADLPLKLPIEVVDGVATVRVTADQERLSEVVRRFSAADVRVEVGSVTDHERDAHLLTDTQRALVADAVRRGYYDTPRECTLTELADANGIAKSTCSETLHRAEGRVMNRFATRFSTPDERTEDESTSTDRALRVA